VLLGREPEASSLITDTDNLQSGTTLQELYASIQQSSEFAADGAKPYGITATTPFATVYSITQSAQLTDGLPVNEQIGFGHLAGY